MFALYLFWFFLFLLDSFIFLIVSRSMMMMMMMVFFHLPLASKKPVLSFLPDSKKFISSISISISVLLFGFSFCIFFFFFFLFSFLWTNWLSLILDWWTEMIWYSCWIFNFWMLWLANHFIFFSLLHYFNAGIIIIMLLDHWPCWTCFYSLIEHLFIHSLPAPNVDIFFIFSFLFLT